MQQYILFLYYYPGSYFTRCKFHCIHSTCETFCDESGTLIFAILHQIMWNIEDCPMWKLLTIKQKGNGLVHSK